MVGHVPAGAKVVIEPVVADNWATDVGVSLPWTPSGDRWYRYATWLTDVDTQGNRLPAGQRRYVVVDQYERTLRPALLDEYVANGFCWLVVGSLQAGRAFAQPQAAPAAVAYYARAGQPRAAGLPRQPVLARRRGRCRSTSTGRSTTSRASTTGPARR